tara:strand:+ start:11142 stop:11729 length:588 start_codon:yes stop_codon:yes gene_type:complete
MIEVITGPMFSGKTTELLRKVDRLEYGNVNYAIFKPSVDSRYSSQDVVSHNEKRKKSIVVDNAKDIKNYLDNNKRIKTIAIDEAQFFSKKDKYNIIDLCKDLELNGYHIIINGLDRDYKGEPFGCMPELMAIATKINKLKAVCMYPGCNKDASYTKKTTEVKKIKNKEINVELGSDKEFEANCLKHWKRNNEEKK